MNRLKVCNVTFTSWAHMVDKIGVEPIPTVFQTAARTGYATCPYWRLGWDLNSWLRRLQLRSFNLLDTQPLKNRQHNPVLAACIKKRNEVSLLSPVAYFLAQENIHFIKRELNLDLRHIDFVIVYFSFAIVRYFFILTIEL